MAKFGRVHGPLLAVSLQLLFYDVRPTFSASQGDAGLLPNTKCACDSSNVSEFKIFLPISLAAPLPAGLPDAVRKGDLLYTSQQIGEDLLTRTVEPGLSPFYSMQRALNNTLLILNHVGCHYRNAVFYYADYTGVTEHLSTFLPMALSVFPTIGLTAQFDDKVYLATTFHNFADRSVNRQNVSYAFRYVAYACNWTLAARNEDVVDCPCQRPYVHHAWDLPLSLSLPLPITSPFRRVSRAGNRVYVTGTSPQDYLGPTQPLVPGGLRAQVPKSLDNLVLELAQAGCTLEHLTHVETLVTNASISSEIDAFYNTYFGDRSSVKDKFLIPKTLVISNKNGAELVHIVQAANCNWTTPQYSVVTALTSTVVNYGTVAVMIDFNSGLLSYFFLSILFYFYKF